MFIFVRLYINTDAYLERSGYSIFSSYCVFGCFKRFIKYDLWTFRLVFVYYIFDVGHKNLQKNKEKQLIFEIYNKKHLEIYTQKYC